MKSKESLPPAPREIERAPTQYLVKWKGYPDSKNSWLPAKELQTAKELLKQFHDHQVHILTTNQALQAQWKPKEGILSQASPASPHLKRGSYEKPPSPPSPALKPSYSQIVKTKKPSRDPEKQTRDPKKISCDQCCDGSSCIFLKTCDNLMNKIDTNMKIFM